ncbi:hypothetical protein RI367_007279 [Sorochytrium milnesiophthora]
MLKLPPLFWEVGDMLVHISSLDTSDLHALSVKTAVLLALTACWRPKDTGGVESRWTEYDSSAIPAAIRVTAFLVKEADQKSYTWTRWADDDTIYPVVALTTYLRRVDDSRRPADRSLFLISRKPHRPASEDTIGNWVKGALHAIGARDRTLSVESQRRQPCKPARTSTEYSPPPTGHHIKRTGPTTLSPSPALPAGTMC